MKDFGSFIAFLSPLNKRLKVKEKLLKEMDRRAGMGLPFFFFAIITIPCRLQVFFRILP